MEQSSLLWMVEGEMLRPNLRSVLKSLLILLETPKEEEEEEGAREEGKGGWLLLSIDDEHE